MENAMTKSYVLWQSAIAAGIVAAILVLLVVFRVNKAKKGGGRIQPGPDWDFSESWASTATLGAATFAAFFGSSDVVTALQGDKASVGPVIVVASAIALALITVAPLVVKAFSEPTGESSAAIVVAAAITISAALLEGIVIVWLAKDFTELGGWENWPTKLAGAAIGCLLLTYAFRSLTILLESPTPAEAATQRAEAERKARAASIALAIANAKAVAASEAESLYAESRVRAGLADREVHPAVKSTFDVAKAAAEQANQEAEQATADAAETGLLVARRRAAIL
jgi:hypothetical protein